MIKQTNREEYSDLVEFERDDLWNDDAEHQAENRILASVPGNSRFYRLWSGPMISPTDLSAV